MILANGTPAAKTMQQASRTVPVIFIAGSDPVLDGLVLSLAHPGDNLTGFYVFEPSLAKLLELLKEMAPHVARVAILSNPDASWHVSVAPGREVCGRSGGGHDYRSLQSQSRFSNPRG